MEILEHSSTKQHKVSKDEGSVKKERDNNIDELLKRNNIKRKRSRSPIEEPSSSKRYIENTPEDKVIRSGHSYKSEQKRSSRPRHGDEDEIYEYPDSKTENNKKTIKCRSKSPSTSNTCNERYTKTLPPGAKERREQQEKERKEQLKKDYANLSYGGKVVAGDGSSTGDYTTIKDGNEIETELIEADSTSNAENENLNEENSIEEDNEIPLEDILQGKNPILYCTLGAKFRDLQLEFDQIKEEGPQHDRIFTWKMKIGNLETVGTGNSKKSAKNDAAEKMVRLLYKAPRPMRKPMWGPYGPPCAMFPPGMPGPPGMFPPFPRGFRPPPDMIRPPIGMFGPRPGMNGPSSSFGGSFGPFPPGFLGPRPPFNGPMQFPMPRPEMLVSTPEELEFGSMTTQNCEENELAPPGEVRPSSTMDSLFEVKAGSSTMDSLYQPEEGSTSNTYVQPTTIEGNYPPQFDRYAGANNPISKLYDMAKKRKNS